jgi:hypothetical protein
MHGCLYSTSSGKVVCDCKYVSTNIKYRNLLDSKRIFNKSSGWHYCGGGCHWGNYDQWLEFWGVNSPC